MKSKKEIFKDKFIVASAVAFMLFLAVYFVFRDSRSWVSLIIPEFLGVTLLGIIITLALKKNINNNTLIVILLAVFAIGVFGFIYGRMNNIRFLVDLSPELLGSTALGAIFTGIFGRKMIL